MITRDQILAILHHHNIPATDQLITDLMNLGSVLDEQAVADHMGITLMASRPARSRDKQFPKPIFSGRLWDREAVVAHLEGKAQQRVKTASERLQRAQRRLEKYPRDAQAIEEQVKAQTALDRAQDALNRARGA